MENLAEDADVDFFSRVLHNENHVLHPLLPERNDDGYELPSRRHERGLFLRQRCQTQFYIQTVTIRYDTIKEFNVDSKAEYTA